MYCIGDRIVHPLHGAGIVEDVFWKQLEGINRNYYVFRFSVCSVTVTVPCDACAKIGVRSVMDADRVDELLASLDDIPVEKDLNWNRRYKDNMVKIKSGDLMQVACVIKSLYARDRERRLSTGDRKMLLSARQIFISELMLSKDICMEEAESLLDELLP